jgi:hypothetical protein
LRLTKKEEDVIEKIANTIVSRFHSAEIQVENLRKKIKTLEDRIMVLELDSKERIYPTIWPNYNTPIWPGEKFKPYIITCKDTAIGHHEC